MDYDKLFTIEHLTDKGWEVCYTSNSLNDAINKYRNYMLMTSYNVYRLTSPTDTSIYQ